MDQLHRSPYHSAMTETFPFPLFEVPRPRPQSLSDPFGDNEEFMLRRVLAKSDEQLDWGDYQCLLGPHLPAGSYEELLYFLPRAFTRILRHEDEALDLCTSLTWFASEYAEQIQADGVLGQTKTAIRTCLSEWTRWFEVRHFDKSACVQKGWVLDYKDYVRRQEVVGEALGDLVRFKTHVDLAEELLQSLAEHGGDSTKAAWFLELARGLAADGVYCLPRHAHFVDLVRDPQLLMAAAATVRDKIIGANEPSTYWRDLFQVLRPLRL